MEELPDDHPDQQFAHVCELLEETWPELMPTADRTAGDVSSQARSATRRIFGILGLPADGPWVDPRQGGSPGALAALINRQRAEGRTLAQIGGANGIGPALLRRLASLKPLRAPTMRFMLDLADGLSTPASPVTVEDVVAAVASDLGVTTQYLMANLESMREPRQSGSE